MLLSRRKVAGLVPVSIIALLGTACGTIIEAEGEAPDPASPAAIDYTASGGIAGFDYRTHVDSASGHFTYSVTAICGDPNGCRIHDSASGTLPRAIVDDLFARAMLDEFRVLRSDYGSTENSADMMLIVLALHQNGRVRSIRADDGTMPSILAHFVHDLQGAVVTARGHTP
jgi:hypothetical protein